MILEVKISIACVQISRQCLNNAHIRQNERNYVQLCGFQYQTEQEGNTPLFSLNKQINHKRKQLSIACISSTGKRETFCKNKCKMIIHLTLSCLLKVHFGKNMSEIPRKL